MRSSSFGAKTVTDNLGFLVTIGTTEEEGENAAVQEANADSSKSGEIFHSI